MLTPPEGEMGSSEKAVADTIKKQAKMIGKVAMTYKFQDLAPLLAEMKTVLEKSNKLPGANPKIDTDEYEYPFEKVSAYLNGAKSAKVVAKIEEAAPAHRCNCDPTKCQCATSDEAPCQVEGVFCQFCDDTIAVGSTVHIGEGTGIKMCAVCARILWEKVRLKETVAYAVINLVEDASSEADEPYFQFKESLKLVEEAQKRLADFRAVQRAKVGK